MTVDPSVVRQWARDQGLVVAERGRLSAKLVEQYQNSLGAQEPAVTRRRQPSAPAQRTKGARKAAGAGDGSLKQAPPAVAPAVEAAPSSARRSGRTPRPSQAPVAAGAQAAGQAGDVARWSRLEQVVSAATASVVVAAAVPQVGCSTVAALVAAATGGGSVVLAGVAAAPPFRDFAPVEVLVGDGVASACDVAVVDLGVVGPDDADRLRAAHGGGSVLVVTTLARPVAELSVLLAKALKAAGADVRLVVNQAFSGSGVTGGWLTKAAGGAPIHGTIPVDVPAVVRAGNEGVLAPLLRHRTIAPQAALLGAALFDVTVTDVLASWAVKDT